MRNKKKKANLFLFAILLTAGFFGFGDVCLADDDLIISEILVGGEKADEEFIEIYNPTVNSIDLETLPLKLHTINSSGVDTNKNLTLSNNTILANGYFIISSKEYKEKFSDIVDAFYGSGVLARGWSVYISKSQEKSISVLDIIKWEECEKNYSYSFNGTDWKCTSLLTPGKENEFDKIPEPIFYSDKIIINELLPKPDSENNLYKEEFVELFNGGDNDENLTGWFSKDRAGKLCDLSGETMGAGSFLVVKNNPGKKCTLALNDTQGEFLGLYSPADKDRPISSVSYEGSAKKGKSYSFDGEQWHWSQYLTPGEDNLFNNLPVVSSKKESEIYVGVYALFSAKSSDKDGEKLKFTWDFGDGHKSYKKKTRHKYEKAGKYTVTLKIFDGSEEKIETFNIEVKKLPKAKVKITSLSPNPSGKDSDFEWIGIENKSKSKINLKGWSVATGSKKLYNHPVIEDFVIEKGERRKLTRDICKFTLNNKKNKIELRYPDGRVAYKVKYKKEGRSVEENEIYEKVDGKWQWIKMQKDTKKEQKNTEILENDAEEIAEEDFSEFSGGQSVIKGKDNKMKELVNYGVKIRLANYDVAGNPRVLGISTEKRENSVYQFTEARPAGHYAAKFFKNLLSAINYLINKLIGGFY